MAPQIELRLFQGVVVVASLVPIIAGLAGVIHGPAMIHGYRGASADQDSHFSYLSGLLLGTGGAFLVSLRNVRQQPRLFRMLGLIVIVGGLARLLATSRSGLPSVPHQLALVMELVIVPGLLFWQRRLVLRPAVQRTTGRAPDSSES